MLDMQSYFFTKEMVQQNEIQTDRNSSRLEVMVQVRLELCASASSC